MEREREEEEERKYVDYYFSARLFFVARFQNEKKIKTINRGAQKEEKLVKT